MLEQEEKENKRVKLRQKRNREREREKHDLHYNPFEGHNFSRFLMDFNFRNASNIFDENEIKKRISIEKKKSVTHEDSDHR